MVRSKEVGWPRNVLANATRSAGTGMILSLAPIPSTTRKTLPQTGNDHVEILTTAKG